MPPFRRAVYVLRSQTNSLMSVCATGSEQPMVIGFRTAVAARKVQNSMHPGREIELLQTRPVRATIKFPKLAQEDDVQKLDLALASMNVEEFSRLPYTRALGIVFAVDVERESTHDVSFRAMVVDAQNWILGDECLDAFAGK